MTALTVACFTRTHSSHSQIPGPARHQQRAGRGGHLGPRQLRGPQGRHLRARARPQRGPDEPQPAVQERARPLRQRRKGESSELIRIESFCNSCF